ncbi:MAG TPA: hypothetical protein DEF06_01175 [Clostridiales bacterium]|jgi:hypothetical protein|nr:hypothetical protein [Clostridiales bacterium]
MKLPENLPSLKGRSRKTLLSILLKNEYDSPLFRPDQVEFMVTGERKDAFAGKAFQRHVLAKLTLGERRFDFLFQVVLPTFRGAVRPGTGGGFFLLHRRFS